MIFKFVCLLFIEAKGAATLQSNLTEVPKTSSVLLFVCLFVFCISNGQFQTNQEICNPVSLSQEFKK